MDMNLVKKILVVKLDHIGDLLLATPVFRAIKEKYTEVQLDILIGRKSFSVVENSPFIDNIYFYDSDDFDRNSDNDERTYLENYFTVCKIRENSYDLCIGLREDLNNLCIQKMLGAKYNISFSTHSDFAVLMDETTINDDKKHAAEINFDLLKLIGIHPPINIQPEIFLNRQDEKWAKDFLKKYKITDENIIIAISPGGGWYLNWWPHQNFAKLANELISYDSQIKIVWVGGNAEREILDKIRLEYKGGVISAVGKTTIPQLAALCKNVDLVITNDGGPMHIATAVRAKVLALFGPSPYKRFGPLGENSTVITKNYKCSPCTQFVKGHPNQCKSNKCMMAISIDEVLKKAISIIEGVRKNEK